jgi:anti-anti-sigma factor
MPVKRETVYGCRNSFDEDPLDSDASTFTDTERMLNETMTLTKIIQPPAIFDGTYGQQLRQSIEGAIQAGVTTILLDCEAITFMDSSGLAALVVAFKQIREVKGRLCFCALSDQVRLLFELTDMISVFEIFPDREAFDRQSAIAL